MHLTLPNLSLVILIGPAGSGKSTFARTHFAASEVLSSDAFRGMVGDDPSNQAVSGRAFELLHHALDLRLAGGRFTVVDATNLKSRARQELLAIAQHHQVPVTGIVFALPQELCVERAAARPDRPVPAGVVQAQYPHLLQTLQELPRQGYQNLVVLRTAEEVAGLQLGREKPSLDQREDRGPFDIVGDVHGCLPELEELLGRLGYLREPQGTLLYRHPAGRKLVFVGDLVDRGPDTPGVLQLVMETCQAGGGHCVMGNHDFKLWRKLVGQSVKVSPGLRLTLDQIESCSAPWRAQVRDFLGNLPFHLLLDGGDLVVAHAGLTEELHGRASDRVRAFALYGDTSGETDAYGLPVRGEWWTSYRGAARVVCGHTPIREPRWVNRCLCIDTACVFGGALTALRYPELELRSVPARTTYAESRRPVPQCWPDSSPPPGA